MTDTSSGQAESARSLRQHFVAEPRAVPLARRFVLSAGWSDDEDTNLRLGTLVSEIVTNAVLHARTPFDVEVRQRPDGIRVSVTDGSPERPTKRDYAPTQPTGRGLRIVEALSDRWGVVSGRDDKTVWFELDAVSAGA